MRLLVAELKEPPGLHVLMPHVVDTGAGVVHGPQERVFVRVLRHARKDFADLNAGDVGGDGFVGTADFGRRVRLHVPGVELAGPADQHQQNAIDVAGRLHRSGGLEDLEVPQCQAEERQRPRVEEIAPSQSIAEVNALFRVESEHHASRRGPAAGPGRRGWA
jgi:hypothetical protein